MHGHNVSYSEFASLPTNFNWGNYQGTNYLTSIRNQHSDFLCCRSVDYSHTDSHLIAQ